MAELLFLVGLALLPLQSAGTIEVVYTIAPSYVVLGLAVAVGLPEVLLGARRTPRTITWAATFVLAVYCVMTALGDFVTVSEQARGGSLRALVYTTYVGFGIVVILLFVGLANAIVLRRAVIAVICGGVLVALYGIYTWFALHYHLPLSDVNNAVNSDGFTYGHRDQGPGLFGWERIRATFSEPLGFGGFLVLPLLLCAGVVQTRRGRARTMAISAIGLMAVALALTDSSISAAALVLGILVGAWQFAVAGERPGLAVGATVGLALGLFLIFALLFNPAPLARITNRSVASLEVTLSDRTSAWKDASAVWATRPVLGHGPGQAAARLAERPDEARVPGAPVVLRSAQGIVMSSLIDVGLLGLAGWILLSTAALKLAFGRALRGHAELAWYAGALIAGLFVTALNGDRVDLRVWVGLGIVAAAASHGGARRTGGESHDGSQDRANDRPADDPVRDRT